MIHARYPFRIHKGHCTKSSVSEVRGRVELRGSLKKNAIWDHLAYIDFMQVEWDWYKSNISKGG